VIVSFSSVFVNGLEQRRSAAFSGRSSGIFLLTGKSDRRKRSRNRDLDRPATSGIPENRCGIGFCDHAAAAMTGASPAKYTASGVA
jgi:hypothetical protein